MTTLTDFLLARIAEDEVNNGCYGEGEYETCFRRTERIERECEAKRRIVGLHGGDYDGECQSPSHLDGPCRTLRALALPYADHPDYREEWKP